MDEPDQISTDGNGSDVTAAQRRRGRPPIAPAKLHARFRTLVWIDSWQRTALLLAKRDALPYGELEKIMKRERVPVQFWGRIRAARGRHRPYCDAPESTERQRQRLAALADLLDSKPPERWTKTDRRRELERARLLAKLHGKPTVKQIEETIQGGTSAPGIVVLATTHVAPVYLRGLWRAFDAWGARRHGIAAKTIRDLRRTLQHSEDPLFAWLRRENVANVAKPKRHRAK